jgi:eukaryotic-like serine/threonine-protein kinase
MTRITWDPGLTTDAAPSPAGNLLAYASDRAGNGNLDIWVQPLPQGEPIRLTRHAADDYEPSFSPDGSRIVFRSDRNGGGVYVVSALGGPETRIAEKGRRPRFSPRGDSIAYWVGDITWVASEVYVVPSTGGQPRQLGESRLALRQPIWSPDGTHLLCEGFPTQVRASDWIALPVNGGDAIVTGAGEILARAQFRTRPPDAWSADGKRVVFSGPSGDSTNLWTLGVSTETWKASGPPAQLTFGTGVLEHPARAGDRLYFTSTASNVDVWGLPLDTAAGRVAGPLGRLTDHPGRDDWPSISEDGSRVAYLSERSGAQAVWLKDLRRALDRPVTRPPASARYPRITADGSRVAYLASAPGDDGTRLVEPPATASARVAPAVASQRETSIPIAQRGNLFVATIGPDGEIGGAREVCHEWGRPWDWSHDSRYLLYRAPAALMLLEVETGARTEIVSHATFIFQDSRFSPDDRWIAFTSPTGTFTRRTFVAPFRGAVPIPESQWILAIDGQRLERQVSWSPDGGLLYFHSERDGNRCLWAQRLHPHTKRPLGEPFAVQHFHGVQGSMTTGIGDPGAISPSLGRDIVVFTLGEKTGNIWSTTY